MPPNTFFIINTSTATRSMHAAHSNSCAGCPPFLPLPLLAVRAKILQKISSNNAPNAVSSIVSRCIRANKLVPTLTFYFSMAPLAGPPSPKCYNSQVSFSFPLRRRHALAAALPPASHCLGVFLNLAPVNRSFASQVVCRYCYKMVKVKSPQKKKEIKVIAHTSRPLECPF
jgi:hypothetical protein